MVKSCETCQHRHLKQNVWIRGEQASYWTMWICRKNRTYGKVCREWDQPNKNKGAECGS